ncbi:MAG: lysozyme inhibitor LprI family protein [Terrimicrobiaceae bacterium]|nr:lysozyme inhibitor LprI family protein [Terrimicrobiaceae bacterium]
MFVILPPSTAWSQSQSEMNEMAQVSLEKADKRLNAVYQKLLSKRAGEKVFCDTLRMAQRAWLKFVDLHMQSVFPLSENENPHQVHGSMYPLDYAEEKRTLVEERTRQLESLLNRAQ